MSRQDVEHNLVSQHVEWGWKEENKCDVAFTTASYECVHVNKSWRQGRSRWSSCGLRFHMIAALLGLAVCVQQSDGQVHETHETTRTQIGWFQPWFYLYFGCPQDIHTKKNKRETNLKSMLPPPGSLVLQDTDVRTFYGWGYIQTCLGWRQRWNGSIEWRFRMGGGGGGGWMAMQNWVEKLWLDRCRSRRLAL